MTREIVIRKDAGDALGITMETHRNEYNNPHVRFSSWITVEKILNIYVKLLKTNRIDHFLFILFRS